MQALTEASEDTEIRRCLHNQMQESQVIVSDVIKCYMEDGGILQDRDPSAEAWIFISIGLLGTVGRRVGSLLEEDFEAIISSRRKWMTGAETPQGDSDHPPPETGSARRAASQGANPRAAAPR